MFQKHLDNWDTDIFLLLLYKFTKPLKFIIILFVSF